MDNLNFRAPILAPPGTKILVHHKSGHRHSWDPHGQGFYIGPSLEHYRCVKYFIPSSRSEVNSDTVAFFPHEIRFPEVTKPSSIIPSTHYPHPFRRFRPYPALPSPPNIHIFGTFIVASRWGKDFFCH